MIGRERNTDTGADVELMTVELIGCGNRFQKAAGGHNRRFPLPDAGGRQNGEFVAAKPRHRVGAAHAVHQAIGD